MCVCMCVQGGGGGQFPRGAGGSTDEPHERRAARMLAASLALSPCPSVALVSASPLAAKTPLPCPTIL